MPSLTSRRRDCLSPDSFKRKFRYVIPTLCWFLLSSLLLVACGDPTTSPLANSTTSSLAPTIGSPASAANPVTITWSYWGDKDETAINSNIIKEFEKGNPGIKIQVLNDSWGNYFTKLKTEWVGDKAPDVMFLSFITSYAKGGLLENLEPYLAKDKAGLNLEDFYTPLLNSFRFNGDLYGLPRDNDTKVIYVNLDLLKEAGVELPKAGWTWQDLLNASRKLTLRDANTGKISRYGFAFEPNQWWKLWVWQNGGEIYNEFKSPQPPTKLLLNSKEAIDGVQFFADLINKEQVAPPPDQMDSSEKIAKMFVEGKVAMTFGNHALVPTYSKAKDLHWDVVPLPQGKKSVNVIAGAGYTLNKNSQHKAEAWTFLKFLSSDFGQTLFSSTGLMVPSRQSIREDNIYLKSVKYNSSVFLDETAKGREYPIFLRSNEVDSLMDTELLPVWQGKATAASVFAQLPAKVEPILNNPGG
ncbi:MAG: sugar ABC transporter substrate-binding protein [Chloroflexi bacterium]|nr:sugar ABC transporter substrate-binding protein [Chloroflexota bacterium]